MATRTMTDITNTHKSSSAHPIGSAFTSADHSTTKRESNQAGPKARRRQSDWGPTTSSHTFSSLDGSSNGNGHGHGHGHGYSNSASLATSLGSPPDLRSRGLRRSHSTRTSNSHNHGHSSSLDPSAAFAHSSSTGPTTSTSKAERRQSRSPVPPPSFVDEAEEDAALAAEAEANDDQMKIPLAPPSAPPADEEFEEILAARTSGEHSLGGWHYAPLIVGLGPPLGAILGGKAENWSDGILLILSSFWLFQCLKIPNDIYHAARTRRILQSDQEAEQDGVSAESPERKRRRQLAISELHKAEIIALICTVASPIIGAYVLNWLVTSLHDGSRYLNQFNIRLFMMAAGIRPWLHAFKLLRRRLLLLQEDVHYPSAKVESLQRRIMRLEADLSSLRRAAVSKSEVKNLREGLDAPLSQMSRSIRRYERKEESLRSTSDDKFALVESRLEDLLRECAINAELIEAERIEREKSSTIGRIVLEVFRSSARRPAVRSYSSPDGRGLPSSSTPAGLVTGPPGSTARSPGGSTLNPSHPWASHRNSDSALIAPRLAGNGSSSSPSFGVADTTGREWYEQGMLYWAFLPLNLSTSMLRYAGDKMGSRKPMSPPANFKGKGPKMIGPAPATSNGAGAVNTHQPVTQPAQTPGNGMHPSGGAPATAFSPPRDREQYLHQQQHSGANSSASPPLTSYFDRAYTQQQHPSHHLSSPPSAQHYQQAQLQAGQQVQGQPSIQVSGPSSSSLQGDKDHRIYHSFVGARD